jgi:hypothetical protein
MRSRVTRARAILQGYPEIETALIERVNSLIADFRHLTPAGMYLEE